MRAVGKYVVIKTIDIEVKTESGLFLSNKDVEDMRYKTGIVLAAGDEVTAIKEGDHVYYDKRSSYTMLIDGEKCTILLDRDIVVVL